MVSHWVRITLQCLFGNMHAGPTLGPYVIQRDIGTEERTLSGSSNLNISRSTHSALDMKDHCFTNPQCFHIRSRFNVTSDTKLSGGCRYQQCSWLLSIHRYVNDVCESWPSCSQGNWISSLFLDVSETIASPMIILTWFANFIICYLSLTESSSWWMSYSWGER